MSITLYTSGSTSIPKHVVHQHLSKYVQRTINEIKLTPNDIVLNIFPSNVIAYYTITAIPALTANSHLISADFDPYTYIRLFKEHRPTVISLIPRHVELLEKIKGWSSLDMSCVRYMVTGSQPVKQSMIDSLNDKGIRIVANWYGMTEFPPPVLIGYNSEKFTVPADTLFDIKFSSDGECIINGNLTGDIFDLTNNTFKCRKTLLNLSTWKTR